MKEVKKEHGNVKRGGRDGKRKEERKKGRKTKRWRTNGQRDENKKKEIGGMIDRKKEKNIT